MKPSVDAGKLRDVLQVLELKESPEGTWTWQKVRKARGQVELSTGRNLFSTVGIGARRAEIILRRQELTLHNALLWGKQHLFLTAILSEGRLHLRVQAALVEPAECQADMDEGGSLVGVSGINYEVQLAHTLDPCKNEYEIVRTEDL